MPRCTSCTHCTEHTCCGSRSRSRKRSSSSAAARARAPSPAASVSSTITSQSTASSATLRSQPSKHSRTKPSSTRGGGGGGGGDGGGGRGGGGDRPARPALARKERSGSRRLPKPSVVGSEAGSASAGKDGGGSSVSFGSGVKKHDGMSKKGKAKGMDEAFRKARTLHPWHPEAGKVGRL